MYKHITSYKLIALNCIRWIYQFKKSPRYSYIYKITIVTLFTFFCIIPKVLCMLYVSCVSIVSVYNFLYPRVYSNMWFVVFFFLKSMQLVFSEQSFLIQQNTIGHYRSVQYRDEFVTLCVRSSRVHTFG